MIAWARRLISVPGPSGIRCPWLSWAPTWPRGPAFWRPRGSTIASPTPPRLMVGLGKEHATNVGIREHGEFSVCIPSVDQVVVTDWCGIVSAKKGVDKAAPFTIFRGSLQHAPMIAQCPLCIECRVHKTVELDGPEIFIADVVGTWTEERFLHPDGKPDFETMRPFVLSMPDGRYYAIGDHIADAWSAGRGFKAS
ncbi:MAG TPA: flavin reductase family protein [Thermoanaerobaculaceae bacterium]|nr:flavin reductase family protein [Thermoanaerobaculaceae bacterium]